MTTLKDYSGIHEWYWHCVVWWSVFLLKFFLDFTLIKLRETNNLQFRPANHIIWCCFVLFVLFFGLGYLIVTALGTLKYIKSNSSLERKNWDRSSRKCICCDSLDQLRKQVGTWFYAGVSHSRNWLCESFLKKLLCSQYLMKIIDLSYTGESLPWLNLLF